MPLPALNAKAQLDPKRWWAALRERLDRRTLKVVGAYCLYALVLAAVLLYLYFPTDKLKSRIQAEFASHVPAQLYISRVRVVFGPALRLEGVSVRGTGEGASRVYMEADRITLKPSWRTLFGGAACIDYEATLGAGTARGQIKTVGEGAKQRTALTADIKGLILKRGMLLKQLFGLELSGLMAGKVQAELGETLAQSSGKLSFEIDSGKLSGIDSDAVPLESVKFKKLNFDCDLGSRKLTVRRADLSHSDMSNKLSGSIGLADNTMESRLDLRGHLAFSDYVVKTSGMEEDSPDAAKQGLDYTVTGTLRQPKFALGQPPKPDAADEAAAAGDEGDEEALAVPRGAASRPGLRPAPRYPQPTPPPPGQSPYAPRNQSPRTFSPPRPGGAAGRV